MKELKDMTVTELEELKTELYKTNHDNGNIQKLYTIARQLGEPVSANYGPKYLLKDGDKEIYVDDYGNYMTVHVLSKLKVSTHNEKLYVPGLWEEIITRLYPKAAASKYKEESKTEDSRKQDLLNQLT